MRALIVIAGACALAACNFSTASAGTLPPSTLPGSVVVDDQLGVSVELAYQAASVAERLVGRLHPASAPTLIKLDNEAFNAVCLTRSAYDVANGNDPAARQDACSASTKDNKAVSYAQAAQNAIEVIRSLVSATQSANQ